MQVVLAVPADGLGIGRLDSSGLGATRRAFWVFSITILQLSGVCKRLYVGDRVTEAFDKGCTSPRAPVVFLWAKSDHRYRKTNDNRAGLIGSEYVELDRLIDKSLSDPEIKCYSIKHSRIRTLQNSQAKDFSAPGPEEKSTSYPYLADHFNPLGF